MKQDVKKSCRMQSNSIHIISNNSYSSNKTNKYNRSFVLTDQGIFCFSLLLISCSAFVPISNNNINNINKNNNKNNKNKSTAASLLPINQLSSKKTCLQHCHEGKDTIFAQQWKANLGCCVHASHTSTSNRDDDSECIDSTKNQLHTTPITLTPVKTNISHRESLIDNVWLYQQKILVIFQSAFLWKLIQQRLTPMTHVSYDRRVTGIEKGTTNTSSRDKALPILTSGASGAGAILRKVTKLHNPIVYFFLFLGLGFKYDWCFKSPLYWFVIGFCIKWYRARYVFKIPVWDRQPNWNNIITSKEQEKDLKAYTCKKCGSTLFIAKSREFFFEGDTGFGGLGCFSCGAKGRDNFIMDRDRIVEDVGDMDDYFEYERPLDFVSRAERRKLLQEASGDVDRANQLLVERAAANNNNDVGISSTTTENSETSISSHSNNDMGSSDSDQIFDAEIVTTETISLPEPKIDIQDIEQEVKIVKPKKSKKKKSKKVQSDSSTFDNLDVLDMDAF